MPLRTFPLGPLETNCYLLWDDNDAVVIDAGGDPTPVINELRAHELTLSTVLLTHLHCDHLYGVAELARIFGAKVLAGVEDAMLLDTEIGRGGFMGLPPVPAFNWEPIAPGEIPLLGQKCRVFATPGHSPGGRSFYFPQTQAVFVGDLLFYRSVGRTDLPGGELHELLASVAEQILPLPPETAVYPGHGPATTVGAEKAHNPYLAEYLR